MRKLIKTSLPLLVAMLCCGQSFSSTIQKTDVLLSTRIFDKKDGLIDNHVYQIFEDSRGFFWIISEKGLIFFDGQNFFPVLNHHSSETFKNISIRCEDPSGRIWVRYIEGDRLFFRVFDGQLRIPLAAEQFLPNHNWSNNLKDVSTNEAGEFFILGHDGSLWSKASEGQSWIKITDCISFNMNFAFPKTEIGIWLISDYNPHFDVRDLGYIHKHQTSLHWFTVPSLQFWSVGKFDELVLLTKRKICFLRTSGTMEYEELEDYFPDLNMGMDSIRIYSSQFTYDKRQGYAFLIYNNRLHLANLDKSVAYNIENPFVFQSSFKGLFDKEGNIWIGTLAGLLEIEHIPEKFKLINWVKPEIGSFYYKYSTRGIEETPDGKVFFNAGDQIWRYDPLVEKSEALLFNYRGTADLFWDNVHQCMWTLGKDLLQFDIEGNIIGTYPIPSAFADGYSFGIAALGDSLLVTSTSGMQFFDIKEKKFIPFEAYGDFPDAKDAEIYGFFLLNEQALLLYSNKGIYHWIRGQKIVGRYSVFSKGKYHIPATNVRHIHKDKEGVFWLATTEGLIKWVPEKWETRRITVNDGLADDNLYAVIEDDFGFLWLSSNHGIIQYHKKTGIAKNFTEKHGISNNEFNRLSHLKASDGNIYFGSLNGITRFDPKDFEYNPESLDARVIQLTSLKLTSRKTGEDINYLDNYTDRGVVEIPPAFVNFNLKFAVPDFDIDLPVVYEYTFSKTGEDSWVRLESPNLQIPTLPYGEYTLTLRAIDQNHEFAESRMSIPLKIIPPFYLRKAFIISVAMLIWVFVVYHFYREINKRERQNRQLNKMVEDATATISRDKKIIEAQAERLEQRALEKDRFFANISHEFRSPLTLILGPASLLATVFKPATKEFGLVQTILRNAKELLSLINDLLFLTKMEYDPVKPRLEPIALVEFMLEFTESFEELFAQKNILFLKKIELDEDLWITSDKQFLKIIFRNLLTNAFKFTGNNGRVILELTKNQKGNELIFRVSDNGRGIPESELFNLFDRYYQVHQSDALEEGGTGIGLSLVKELSLALNGRVAVQSKEGEGTTFTVSLPLLVDTPSYKEKKLLKKAAAAQKNLLPAKVLEELGGRSILLVEDNPGFHQYLKFILGEFFDIKTALNGKAALALLERGLHPILIISDLMMPEMDGFQFLSALREKEAYKEIPVLVLTARAERKSKAKALELGVNDYLVKPFDKEQLFKAVSHLLQASIEMKEAKEAGIDLKQMGEERHAFVSKVRTLIEQGIVDQDFSVNQLASEMLMGRTTFYNRVKQEMGMTPNQLILEIRLQKARGLFLENPSLTIKEVLTEKGLKHESHFIDVFTQRFGISPGQMKG